jgi:drug/metabolite transporter (DMT)-like permease
MKIRSPYFYAALAILAWSTVSTAFKLALQYVTPTGLLFLSSMSAMTFLVAVNLITKPGSLFKGFFIQIKRSTIAGFLNPTLYYLMLFHAYDVLRAQEAQVLNYTWAIVLSLLCVIVFKKRFRWLDMLALLLSFLGVIVISTRGNPFLLRFDNPLGSLIAVSTSIVWASYWVLNMRDKRSPETKLMYNFIVGSFFITLWMGLLILLGDVDLFIPGAAWQYGILGGIYVGIFEMGLTFILWQKALQNSENTSHIANLIFLTPFISLLFIGPVLRESIHPATLIGLVMIILSNYLQHIGRKNLPVL